MSELENELRRAGEKVAEGRFRIDAKRALERLKDHRFAEPSHWVLEVLRAAALSGAKQVTVRTDADDVEVTFDGKPFPEDVMKDVLGQGLVAGVTPETRRARLLGLGVAGALGVDPQRLVVESGTTRVSISPAAEVLVERCQRKGTFLALRKKLGWRVAAAVLRGAPEASAIRARCGRFDGELLLNGAAPPAPGWLDAAKGERLTKAVDGVSITAVVDEALDASEVTLDILGVVVTQRRLTLPGVQLRAWVRGDELRTNASGSDVVDNDAGLEAATKALDALSLSGLEAQVKRLQAEPDEELRAALVARLLRDDTPKAARALLEEAPVIPGPAGERVSVAALRAHVQAGQPLYVAHSLYPKDSYPAPTVLHPTAWAKLLPQAKQVDVAEQVQRNRRAAENRRAWLEEPLEDLVLTAEHAVVAKERFDTPQVEGEVGLHDGAYGAFVRLLCQGRFLQQGDVPALVPLRLRAVVNLTKEIPLKSWQEVPSKKLFSLVTQQVGDAANRLILGLLERRGDAPLTESERAHGCDLLGRFTRDRPDALPAVLRKAPLFQTLDGPRLSLLELESIKPWRYVMERFPDPLLNGEPVLQLTLDEHAMLKALKPTRLEDATARLLAEREVRRRLDGPRERAALTGCHVVIPLEAPGMTGEVGIAERAGQQRVIALYRDGFRLDGALVPSTLPQLRAAVDSPALSPDERFEKAQRDDAFKAVDAAVRAHEGRLAAAIVDKYRAWASMPQPCREYLAKWTREALAGDALDGPAQRVKDAPLFLTSAGQRSLAELERDVKAQGHLWVLAGNVQAAPAEPLVVAADAQAAELLTRVVGLPAEDARPELERLAAERAFLARPVHHGRLPANAAPRATGTATGVTLEAGVLGTQRVATVEVLVRGRSLLIAQLPSPLPLVALAHVDGVSPGVAVLPSEARDRVAAALREAERHLLDAALTRPDETLSRRVLFLALAVRWDASADGPLAAKLRAWKGFPCSDGQARDVKGLQALDAVCFSTEPLRGELPDGTPVVLATDDDVRAGLLRFAVTKDVTALLHAEAEAQARRAKLKAVDEVRVGVEARWRRPLKSASLEGELAVVQGGWGPLALLTGKKPLCTVQDALPSPLVAAVNCDTLTPLPGHSGVVRDAVYDAVVDEVLREADALAEDVAAAWPTLDVEAQWHARPETVALLFFVARRTRTHPLTQCALLETTDGQPLALAALLEKSQGRKKKLQVPYAEREGALLDDGKVVWRPRDGELVLARGLGLQLVDVTPQLEHAEKVRGRPKQAQLRAAVDGPWREPVTGKKTSGEVALPDEPTGRLTVQLLQDMTPLERYVDEHPVGAVAEVNCDALRANADWTKVIRNQVFRDVLADVEAALDALLARRLSQGPRDASWAKWALVAASWRREGGALSKVVPGLPVFTRLGGAPVTVGEVLAEFSRTRRVAVAHRGVEPPGSLVLALAANTQPFLKVLGVMSEDVTADLERQKALEASRLSRRLASLGWPGQALVRVDVEAPGLRGQLVLPLGDDASPVKLAREGVLVGPADVGGAPGVAGVLDVDELPVNDDWTEARPTPAQRTAIRQAMDSVYAELAKRASLLPEAHRAMARARALEFLHGFGVKNASHLDRMTDVAALVAKAPLFTTVDGRAVSLRVVADEVLTRGRVAVLQKRFFRPDVGEHFVLQAEALNEPWVEALARVLGDGQVERIDDVAAWREGLKEADPPKDTPEWSGLERLRREVRLLRAGALGRLTPSELEDVRLARAGGKVPVRYDKRRKLVLLDPDDEQVKRALVEYRARPERLFALVAAVYGVVNRALDHITDAHEADLLLALAGHLAANPKLLEPKATDE